MCLNVFSLEHPSQGYTLCNLINLFKSNLTKIKQVLKSD